MKQYESYKDSGIEWLGKIPSHWNGMPIKYILGKSKNNLRVGPFGSALSGDDFQNDGYWVYNQRTVLDNNFMSADAFISKEKYEALHSFAVEAGDILITTRGTIGKIAIVPNNFAPGILHPCIIKFRVDENLIDKIFLKYIFNDCNIISDQVRLNSNSTTIDVIYSYTLKELQVPLPSLSEQQAIVSYLNYKVGQIDAVITEKEKMLEDLKAYRTAIISESVTKGLDKNVEMEDSGIEWIGMIPKHWSLVKLKNKAKVNGRIGFRGYTTADLVQAGEGAYTIGGKHITNCVLDLSNPEYISWDKYYESPEIMVKKGNILMAQRGSLGKTALVREDIGPATINPSLVLLNSIEINEIFLYYYLISNSCLAYIDLLNTATAVPMISQNQIENIFVPIPPMEEQSEIASYLDKKVIGIDHSVNNVSIQIDDLKAYKSSVITEAVTGKVDLRNWRSNNDKK